MWNIKYVIIPIIIGTTGTVTEGLNLEAIPGERAVDSLQKQLRMEYIGVGIRQFETRSLCG